MSEHRAEAPSSPVLPVDRRAFVRRVSGSMAALSLAGSSAALAQQMSGAATVERQVAQPKWQGPPRLKFGVIGLNHGHITGMTEAVIRGGGEPAWVYAKEPALVKQFQERFPNAKLARSEAEVLDDAAVKVVLSASIPDERAPLGIRVMKAGAIGKVLQTIGLGPHRAGFKGRPEWFFDVARYGGILVDIASHQADQFLFFTGSTRAEVVASQAGNLHTPQHPKFQDFGDMMLRGDGGTGYIRVDWFTPDGLPTWGDGRLTILGTDGFIEIRKNVDVAGRPGSNHLFLSDQKQTTYVDTTGVELTYGRQIVSDVLDRTDTAMSQAHCFLAMQLVLEAQQRAQSPLINS